jgi:T4 RnlA family RNA ligase
MKLKGTYIPTYEEALEICNSNDCFYETKHIIDGYNISTFNYRLSNYDSFINPIKNKPEINAKELRGITYVFNNGKVVKRYLALQKFWNLNQVEESMYNNLKNCKLVKVEDKLDGSLCSFIKLPNGKVFSKTQNSFDNEQTEMINKIFSKNENLKNFIDWCEKMNYSSLFEYVSFSNKIVLNYDNPEVILLKVRNNETGEIVNNFDFMGLNIAKEEKFNNLDEVINLVKDTEDKEGWVVTLKNYENEYIMVKIKTSWYCERHRLMDNLERENDIISLVVENKIDDVLSQLNPELDKNKINWVNEIVDITQKFIATKMKEVENLVNKFEGDIGNFAIKYKKDKNFSMAIRVIRKKCDVYEAVKSYLLKNTSKLEKARCFIKRKDL